MRIQTILSLAIAALLATGGAMAQAPKAEGHGRHADNAMARFDSNADGQLQLDEVKAGAARHAAEVDGNADGRIDVAEIQAWRQAKRAMRAEQRLLRADADGDGVVSVDEFAAVHAARFDKRDRNDDGVLSADELKPRRHRMHGRHGHGRHDAADAG